MRVFVSVYRKEKGLSQEDLAKCVNVRRETICRLEQGRYMPSLKLAVDISKTLNIPIEKLFEFPD